MFYANQGGLATAIPKYNQGGINYLPSKIDHDENDVNNYVRATGYVEDGAGVGNKDEDTMLAQLADGEFVSRADAVLGAGILSGADPKSFKGMRKAGADFYDQQKKFKRIYDLVNDTKKIKLEKHVDVLEITPSIMDDYWLLVEFMLREGLRYDGNPMSIEHLKLLIKEGQNTIIYDVWFR